MNEELKHEQIVERFENALYISVWQKIKIWIEKLFYKKVKRNK